MKSTPAIICAALLLAACSDIPLQADLVRDPETAIQIAQNDCKDWQRVGPGHWSARLHDHVWDTRFGQHGDTPTCPTFQDDIGAADGRPHGCTMCVITG